MNWHVQGPFALDLGSVAGSMNALLDAVGRVGSGRDRSDVRGLSDPAAAAGLYALWHVEGERWSLAGVWLVFAPSWLDLGPAGPPDRHPPYVLDVLAAFTEAVWWVNLPVWPRERDTWRPVVVLEWPAPLAARSVLPPPGMGAWDDGAADDAASGTGEGWMAPSRAPISRAFVEPETEGGTVDLTVLPASRSLVTVVRVRLERDGARHVASCRVVPHTRLGDSPTMAPFTEWVTTAAAAGREAAEPDGPHAYGRPLELFGGRVGFSLSGWLTRALTVWPPTPADLRPGSLHARDVGRRWRTQALQALVALTSVTASVLAVGATIDLVSAPGLDAEYVPPTPRPQPALSVCTPDNEPFMRELRCQVAWFAGGGRPEVPVCGDEGADPALQPATSGDLQAAFCGVYDRAQDANLASVERRWLWHEVAAARACYNVLGSPYKYRTASDASTGAPATGDPNLFLHDTKLEVWDLAQLNGALAETCDDYRERTERQVEGAILATFVGEAGDPDSAGGRLREVALARATDGLRQPAARCLRSGAAEGVSTADRYAGLCDPTDPVHARSAAKVGWERMGTTSDFEAQSAIRRYAAARFGEGLAGEEAPPLWQCHARLDLGESGMTAVRAQWLLPMAQPRAYDIAGAGVRSQLALDASLTALQADPAAAGPCWNVVARALGRYAPVHPLLGPLDEKGWPSVSQQLCGQICAARYGFRGPPDPEAWVTAGADLATCVDASPPEAASAAPEPAFDRLRLPWNGIDTWTSPREVDVCAFNLVAQGYLPGGDSGVLVNGTAPQAWAGETALGSGIAGGDGGTALAAATSLSNYGRAHSVATCGHVATQCFGTGLLEVIGDARAEPYAWTANWNAWLTRMARNEPAPTGEQFSPWCGLVRPYLAIDGRLPEGQLEYPCAKGVDDTRIAMERALSEIASGGAP